MKTRECCKFDLTLVFRNVTSLLGTTLGLTICALELSLYATAYGATIDTFNAPSAGKGANQGTFVTGINPEGAIVGFYLDAGNVNHGFVRTPDGAVTTIDVLSVGTGPGQGTIAYGMNPGSSYFTGLRTEVVSEITGSYIDSNNASHGFLRSLTNSITTFDVPGAGTRAKQGTVGGSINLAGEISGIYIDANNVAHGFLRAPDGAITRFDVPSAGTGSGQGIANFTFCALNPAGAVTGFYLDASHHGFLRAPDGIITTFDDPSAGKGANQGTFATCINQEGAIVGAYVGANNVAHAFLRAPDGSFTTFDAPGAGNGGFEGTFATCINPVGAIVGEYIDANDVAHGFLRAPDGTITTFDAPGAGTGKGQGTIPKAINPAGVIAGSYVDVNNVSHGFLKPAPEPAPVITAVIPASQFGGGDGFLTPGEWVEIYGSNLAPYTREWTSGDFYGNKAPSSFDGVHVDVNFYLGGSPAVIDYISPVQVNAQLAYGIPTGGRNSIGWELRLSNGNGPAASFGLPGFLFDPRLLAPPKFQIGGKQYVVALLADNMTYVLPAGAISGVLSRPAHPGETIVLYGIGFGEVSPDIPYGQIVTEANQLRSRVQVLFDETPAQVSYAGLSPGAVGLYQFNVIVPAVPDSDLVPLKFTFADLDGVIFFSSTQPLYTAVHQ